MKFPVIGGVIFLVSGVAALSAVSFFGGADEPETPAVSAAAAATSMVVFSVPDMSCEIVCAPMVRDTLAAIPGVEKVETDLDAHTATLVTSDGFEETKALAALSEAGYPAQRATN
ncbi:MAG: heavy metal-associated domain-containing protein [Planctomycetaceae bacterium]